MLEHESVHLAKYEDSIWCSIRSWSEYKAYVRMYSNNTNRRFTAIIQVNLC